MGFSSHPCFCPAKNSPMYTSPRISLVNMPSPWAYPAWNSPSNLRQKKGTIMVAILEMGEGCGHISGGRWEEERYRRDTHYSSVGTQVRLCFQSNHDISLTFSSPGRKRNGTTVQLGENPPPLRIPSPPPLGTHLSALRTSRKWNPPPVPFPKIMTPMPCGTASLVRPSNLGHADEGESERVQEQNEMGGWEIVVSFPVMTEMLSGPWCPISCCQKSPSASLLSSQGPRNPNSQVQVSFAPSPPPHSRGPIVVGV